MASLATCIRRAGKALDGGDATAIREIFNDYVADDMEAGVAAERAVSDYLGLMDTERNNIVTQIERAGGRIDRPGDLRYARTRPKNRRLIDRLSIMPILDGGEVVDVAGTGAGGKVTMRDLVSAIQERTQGIAGRVLDSTDPADREIIATVLANEVEAAQKRTGHAGDWFGATLANANAIATLVYPELATDVHSQMAFALGLAITSNQQAVPKNAQLAFEIYDDFVRLKKRMPEDKGWGLGSATMRMQFARFNHLIEKWGVDGTRQFLATEYTAREIEDMTGWKVTGEAATTIVHGSAIFGSKIGAGFYQNLIGNPNPLTMDRWFMRTWGRITGKLLEDPESQGVRTRVTNLRNILKRDRKKLKDLGYTLKAITDDSILYEAASTIHRELADRDFEDATDLERAAKSLDEAVNFPIGVPTMQQRGQIRETMTLALQKLRERGVDVTTSSAQALLWFPEKDLYTKHGVGDAKSKPTDYATEFAEIARGRGIDSAAIGAVLRPETGRRPGRTVPRSQAQADQPGKLTEAFSPDERLRRLSHAGTSNVRQRQLPVYGRRLGRSPRKLVGRAVGIAQLYTPEAYARNQWKRVGLAAPPISELGDTSEAVDLFIDKITEAKGLHPEGAAVQIFTKEEYSTMRLFLAEGGNAGFALKGDDIVSVFKHPDADFQGVVQSLLGLAVQEGGRRIDAPDTILPEMYELQGFKVISRVPWDNDLAPEGWNKKKFAKWTGATGVAGEPDYVYMAYDIDNYNRYEPGEGTLVDTSEEASELQLTARDGLEPQAGPLRYRLEDDVAEDMVDRDPEHPLSVIYKFGATMEEQSNLASNDNAGILRRRVDLDPTGKFKEMGLGMLPRNGLVDIMPDERMNEGDSLLQQEKEMDGRRNALAEEHVVLAEKLNKHIVKNVDGAGELTGNVMHAATIWGQDPSRAYRPLMPVNKMNEQERREDTRRRANYKILQAFWKKMSPEGRDLFNEVRDAYAELRKTLFKSLNDRIDASEASGHAKRALKDEIRKKFEAGRVAGPYFPLMRFGKMWAVARDAAGNTIAFAKFERRPDRKAWVEAMRAEGYEVERGTDSANDFQQAQSIDPGFVNKVTELVGNIPGGESIADEIHQLYLRMLPEMSLRHQFQHRKGTLGFSNNVVRAFAHHTYHAAHQIARLEHQHKLEDTLVKLFRQAREAEKLDDKHSDWAMPLYNEWLDRHKLSMQPKHTTLADKATSIGFGWFLGVTPAAALLNLAQTPMIAFPVLMGKNGPVESATELIRASWQYLSTAGSFENKLRDDDLEAFQFADSTGLFDKTRAHDLGALLESGGDFFTARANTMKYVSWLFHKTEELNRQATYMAAYRLARKRGESYQAATFEAYKMTEMSHYDYSSAARPPILQSEFMKVAFLFKNYGLNTTYRFGRDFKDAIIATDLPPERKKEAIRRMGGMWMMTAFFAGLGGLPMAWLIEDILNLVLGDDDEPFDSGNAFKHYLSEDLGLGDEIARAVTTGGWDQLTGIGMHNRLSLSYLALGREAPREMTPSEHYQFLLEEFAGPIAGIAAGFFSAGDDLLKGYPMRGVEKSMPKVVRDVMKTWRFLNEGAQTRRGTPILPPEAFTSKDLFVQAMGATPSKLAHEYEERKEVQRMASKLQLRRRYLIDQLFLARRQGDREATRNWMKKIGAWNKAQPRWPINSKNIQASAKSRQRYDERAVSGLILDPNLQYLQYEMRLTPGYIGGPGRPTRRLPDTNR
jgi:hypothetical protein